MPVGSRGIVAALLVLAGVVTTLGGTRGHVGFAAQDPERYTPLRLEPVDEASLEPTFVAYREAFLRALAARDADRVVSMIQPGLRNRSFVEFLRFSPQQIAGREEAWVWNELTRAISFGGAFTTSDGAVPGRREFCAPYAYARYPPWSHLPAEMGEAQPWVVVGRNVAVRRAPSIKAPVIARVSYELLPVQARYARDESGGPIVWQGVSLADGRYGFVADHLLWGDRDYHACFANIDGQWLLTKFGRGW